jgi:PAS domain-containing protein
MGRQFDPEQFVRAAGDAIIAAGTDGSIVFWNPAAERMFGYTESEALGRSLDLIIPERFRHRHWDGCRGRTLSIAFTVTLLQTRDTQARVIAAIVRDETSRWNEERALRQRLAELEARSR